MFIDYYGNMHPDYIDYTLIDSPLRKLIKAINQSSWAKTISSCAGKACHNNGNLHLVIEVKGTEGIYNFLRWLSLSHALGSKACYENNKIPDFALPKAELSTPNLLRGERSITGAFLGGNWTRFYISLHLGRKPLSKTQIMGGIKALSLDGMQLQTIIEKEK
ncbi:MAG: hypothetical protein QMC83_01450 [Thermodesulfovibrionales bacterium]|nr:hypothetical protein [Thermodesulfovibrionales bacterium]